MRIKSDKSDNKVNIKKSTNKNCTRDPIKK